MVSHLPVLKSDLANLQKQKADMLQKINSLKKERKDVSAEEKELADIGRRYDYVQYKIDELVNLKD